MANFWALGFQGSSSGVIATSVPCSALQARVTTSVFLIHLKWLSPSTWIVPIHFHAKIVRWHYYYSQLYNTFVNCFKKYFKPKVSAPISDNEKLNSFNFKQGTPCQSKYHVHIKTKTLVDLNSIYYERSIPPTTHQYIYI